MQQRQTVAARADQLYAQTVFTRDQLLEIGMSGRTITTAVRTGLLRRLRQNRYARAEIRAEFAEAVRIGGRISCLTLLSLIGVFVLRCDRLHVHVHPGSSRTRTPEHSDTVVHWDRPGSEPHTLHAAPLEDAVRHAMRCQTPRAAIATLDSILHHRLLTRATLERVFAELPARFRPILALVDASAESGPETFVRLMLRALGVRFESQVVIPGVGRVDFVVEGWLIIECDSQEFHEGWAKQVEDRRRDLEAAKQGYVTVRPLASDIMHRSAQTQADLQQVIRTLGSKNGVAPRRA